MAPGKSEALKVEDKQVHDYELVFIVSPTVEGEALDATVDNVSRFITGKGGVISNVEHWGKKKLAYPIEHSLEGSYVLAQFKIKPVSTRELEASLEISEDILRHLLIRLDS